jgi:beta-lactamase class D
MVAVVGVERKANKEVSELLLCDRPERLATRDDTGWDGMESFDSKGRGWFGGFI